MSRTRRSTGSPCNICQYYWPFHANNCTYRMTAIERDQLASDLADLLEYTKELERRLNVAII